ncbi:MAG: hypothetical protein IPJ81_15455 [Chitinophagaceae bacterium]|nr:hypothetical protein [Chitinophagaceae bacterium]
MKKNIRLESLKKNKNLFNVQRIINVNNLRKVRGNGPCVQSVTWWIKPDGIDNKGNNFN